MKNLVSHGTLTTGGELVIDEAPACPKCQIRPRRPYPTRPGKRRRFYGYCGVCQAEDRRERRAGKVEVLLTPEEWSEVKAARRARARGRGRHHRAA